MFKRKASARNLRHLRNQSVNGAVGEVEEAGGLVDERKANGDKDISPGGNNPVYYELSDHVLTCHQRRM